ncbi:hypothetical protein [Halalkalicoccus salilacus]
MGRRGGDGITDAREAGRTDLVLAFFDYVADELVATNARDSS